MRKTQKKAWDAPGILAEVKRKGSTLTGLAEANGLNSSACRTALSRPFPAADKVIADFIGVSLHELWPDRYDENDQRYDRRTVRFRAHNARHGAQPQRQIIEAA